MKRCAITGAAGGIGLALAQAFAAAGYEIIAIDRDQQLAREAQQRLEAQGATASWILAELSADAGLERVLERLPEVDIFIHNAGINAVAPFEAVDIATHSAVLDVNLRAPLLLTRGLLHHGLLRPGGSLVFIASLACFIGYPGAAAYAASKAGLAAFARSLAPRLEPRGVHVLTVFPGPTRTDHARRHSPDNRHEARRMTPERLARAIVQAVARRRRRLVPGLGNRLAALIGLLLPPLAERAMKRSILDRLPRTPTGS